MEKLLKLRKYFAIILMIGIMWGILFILRFTLLDVSNDNLNYVPSEAALIIRIDGEKILTEALSSVILHPEDKELIQLLENLRNRKGKKKGKGLGIAFNSDVVVFTLPSKDKKFTGFLFNLSSSKKFKQNLGALLTENQALHVVGDVGLVISETVDYERPLLSKRALSKFCADILESSRHLDPKKHFLSSSNSKIKVLLQGGIRQEASNILKADLDLTIDKELIELAGQLEISQTPGNYEQTFTTLKPNGFHFSTQLISQEINDSIQAFLGDSIPDVKSLSINYFSTDFIENPSFFIVPNMEGYFVFEKKLNFNLFLKSNPFVKDLTPDYFYYGTVKFYYKQLDDKSIFIGRSKFDEDALTQISEITLLSGQPSAMLKIQGGGMMLKFIKITTLYGLSKDITDRIDYFKLSIDNLNNQKAKFHGSIRFKKEYDAMNELIKFGLKGQFIK